MNGGREEKGSDGSGREGRRGIEMGGEGEREGRVER